MDTTTTTQPPFNLKNLTLTPPQPPPSIAELRHISAALSQFLRDYDDLHNHIGSVNAALDEKLSLRYKGSYKGNTVNSNEFALLNDNNNCVKNVLEGEPNPRPSVSDCVLSDDNVLEGVVSVRKRNEFVLSDDDVLEVVVSRNECVVDDDSDRVVNDVLEVFVSEGVKSYRESDGLKEIVSEGNERESECECERGDENVRMYESVKKDEEIVDALVKMEKSDCAEIIIDVSEAVVSEQNRNGSESARVSGQSPTSVLSECEQGDDDVRMDESPNSRDGCKETDNEGEEIAASKNADETDDEGEKIDAAKNADETDNKGEEIDARKNVEETDDDSEKIDAAKNVGVTVYDPAINELLEEIAVIEKNPIRTASKCDNVKKPQSSSSLESSEETDDEDGGIEASKTPEDSDYERIVTELLEDIDVAPKPNRTASDCDQSYDKPRSPTSSKNHLDEIGVSVNPEDENDKQTDVSMEIEEMEMPKTPAETDVLEKPEEIDTGKNPVETDVSEKPEEADVSEKPEYVEILKNPKPAGSDLEWLCKSMSSREMKKYVVKHILDIDELRKELLKALKLAIDPAKLVLDSIETYFLQSRKTYSRGSYQCLKDQIDERQASVLILECFVMISGDEIKISREDEAYAAKSANLWKNRMMNEGGLKYTEEADARGLLLLISGFGISDRLFDTVDIMDLMMASNVKEISNILRRSIVLMPKIPEVIDMMVRSKLEVQAADIAYTFGLEYKCHPLTILTKFLRNIIDVIESGSPVHIEAMKQQLDDLISVKECLESHNIDPSKVLSEFKIDEEIHQLKKKLKLQVQKRKAMDQSLPNLNHQEAKRTCFSPNTMPRGISSYNHPMRPGYSYLDFNPNLSGNYIPPPLLNAPALPSHYIRPSLLNAPALRVNITNSVTSGLAGPSGNIRPYGWQDESALVEKYLVQPYPRPSQAYDSQPSLTGLYGRRPEFPVCMPGHPGYPGYFPSRGFPARRGPGSDLYAFADVVEKEMRGSRAVGSGTGRSSHY